MVTSVFCGTILGDQFQVSECRQSLYVMMVVNGWNAVMFGWQSGASESIIFRKLGNLGNILRLHVDTGTRIGLKHKSPSPNADVMTKCSFQEVIKQEAALVAILLRDVARDGGCNAYRTLYV